MPETWRAEALEIAIEKVQQIESLYAKGLCLRAYEIAQAVAPLHAWRGRRAGVIAGRLAMNLGAGRLGRILHRKTYRDHSTDGQVIYYNCRALLERRGVLRGWQFMRSIGQMIDQPPAVRGEWLGQWAEIYSLVRDFDRAEEMLDSAQRISPESPWLWVERAGLLERQDRYDDALAAARKCLAVHPWYRPGVQSLAHVLQLFDRDEEALELLTEAAGNIENAPVTLQLAELQMDLRRYEAAQQTLLRAIELSPLADDYMTKAIAARRSDAAYHLGDFDQATRLAKDVGDAYYQKVAASLEKDTQGRRIVLDVPFVRQHHMTCAPATLSAIGKFWRQTVDHLQVVEEICYDGTPAHSERKWAREHGWLPREFSVTWESAVALIDAGIPFTLTTVETTSSHLQSVIGYDARRRTLIVRDPFRYYHGEMLAELMIERYAASGPRGMALVPKDRAGELARIDLPDASLFDQYHDLQIALDRHDRASAKGVLDVMLAASGDHRITQWARRTLAGYDADPVSAELALAGLCQMYPKDQHLTLAHLSTLRALGREKQATERLLEMCARADADPVFWQQQAQHLRQDDRQKQSVLQLIERCLRYKPSDAWAWHTLAGVLWDERRMEEAMEMYRFAATLDDKDDGFARSYFIASRHLKRVDDALNLLRDRFTRFGKRSAQPARTLAWALEDLQRSEEAIATLDQARATRPADGELLLHCALTAGRHGNLVRATDLLDDARPISRRARWLRVAAEISLYQGLPKQSLQQWQEVLETEPLAYDAHVAVANLLAENVSRAAAQQHLEKSIGRFPHHYPLRQLRIEWLRDDEPTAAEPHVRALIEDHPSDAWAQRELAGNLIRQRRFDEASRHAEQAVTIDAANPASHFTLGWALLRLDRLDDAEAALKHAVSLSVDYEQATSALVFLRESPAQRREALAFVRGELIRQTLFGDGLIAYRNLAISILSGEEILEHLNEALAARPDLWHAWSAVVLQLVDVNQLDAALDKAVEATQRFPLLPRLWIDCARVRHMRGEIDEEIEALQTAVELSPAWGFAARELADALERKGQFAEARAMLERTLARAPLDPQTHGCLGGQLWMTGEKKKAVEHLTQAVQLDPSYERAWNMLRHWAGEMGDTSIATEPARALTVRRAGEARSWLIFARMIEGTSAIAPAEQRTALRKAIDLNPGSIDAYDELARLELREKRIDAARAACRPAALNGEQPVELRAREAAIDAEIGHLEEAIVKMKRVAEESPMMYEAWQSLAEWNRRLGDKAEYLKTAEHMARLRPHEPAAMGYLSDALLKNDRHGEAKQVLARAIEVAPSYDYAARKLFDLQMGDGEHSAAAETLTILERYGGPQALARRVRIKALAKDRPAVAEALVQIFSDAHDAAGAWEVLDEALASPEWDETIDQAARHSMTQPVPNAGMGDHLIRRYALRGRWRKCEKILAELRGPADLRGWAVNQYLTQLVAKQRWLRLRWYLWRQAGQLRFSTPSWGAVGYAKLSLGDINGTIRWLGDWRERGDGMPWMLTNLADALHIEGRSDQARDVHEVATQRPDDHTTAEHQAWLAALDAMENRFEAASKRLEQTDLNRAMPSARFVAGMARVMVQTDALKTGASSQQIESIFATLRQAEQELPHYTQQQHLKRLRRAALRRLIPFAGWRARRAWLTSML